MIIGYLKSQEFEHIIEVGGQKKVFIKKTQLAPDKKCEENPQAIPILQVKRGET